MIKDSSKAVKNIQDSINSVWNFIFGKDNSEEQRITSRLEITVTTKVFEAIRYINSRPGGPTATEERLVGQAKLLMADCVEKINGFYENTWPGFHKKMEETEVQLFND